MKIYQMIMPVALLSIVGIALPAFARPYCGCREHGGHYCRMENHDNRNIAEKLAEIDSYLKFRADGIDKIADREMEFLRDKINFLGILIAIGGILSVLVPVYAGIKIRRTWENSKKALERAECAIKMADDASSNNLRTRGMQNFVHSKNSFRQYVALSDKFSLQTERDYKKDTLGALWVGIDELRINFLAQSIIYIERAIAYNVEAKSGPAVRSNLAMLEFYINKINVNQDDKKELKRRLKKLKWTHSVAEIRHFLLVPSIAKSRLNKLVVGYEMASSEFGVVTFS